MVNGDSIIEQLRGGLIVSCQALEGEPLFGADIMAKMALAAKEGGAVAIRANGVHDIQSIRLIGLPIIGIIKRDYPGNDVYITPTLTEVEAVVEAGADIVAVDATDRVRPDGLLADQFIRKVKDLFPHVLLMADVSTYDEGLAAQDAGTDLVASTMAGYTPYTESLSGPDLNLISRLAKSLRVPVIAEGRVRTPEQAAQCLQAGALAVVVGTAITRPQVITREFVEKIKLSKAT